MKSLHAAVTAVMLGPLAVSVFAQSTPSAGASATQPTDPSAASSPHQRSVTQSPSSEAPTTSGANPSDASTPHQKQTVKKHTKHKKKAATSTSSGPTS